MHRDPFPWWNDAVDRDRRAAARADVHLPATLRHTIGELAGRIEAVSSVGAHFVTGAVMWGTKLSDVLRAFNLAPAVEGRPFYVTNEAELKTWAFDVQPDGTLARPKLFVQEGGESLTTDGQGNVYIAAGQIRVFSPSGEPIEVIRVPQRPTSLAFGGPDHQTLFITARSALYAAHPRSAAE